MWEQQICHLSLTKSTFGGVFTTFESFIFKSYKCILIDTLLYGRFNVCSNMEKFHQEINTLKSVFKSNSYPNNLIDLCFKNFLDKVFARIKVSFTVPKLQLVYMLSCSGKSSFNFRALLRRTVETKICHFVSLMLFLDPLADLVSSLNWKIPVRKKSTLE